MTLRFSILAPGDTLYRTVELHATLFQLRMDDREPLSVTLERRREARGGTEPAWSASNETALAALYRDRAILGSTQAQALVDEEEERIEPRTTLPSSEQHTLYMVIALRAEALEEAVRAHGYPRFALLPELVAFCDAYRVPLARTFPSLSRDPLIAQQFHRVHPRRRDVRAWHAEQRLFDDDEEEVPTTPDPNAVQRERRVRRHLHESQLPTGRLLPVCFLPLLLARFGAWYQLVNGLLAECEMLEKMLWNWTCYPAYPPYLQEQVHALAANRRYLAFVMQQAHFNQRRALREPLLMGALGAHDVERDFYRREIQSLRQSHEDEVGEMRAMLARLATLVTQLKQSSRI